LTNQEEEDNMIHTGSVERRVYKTTSLSGTYVIDPANYEGFVLTALANNLTIDLHPAISPHNGKKFYISLADNGSARRTITFSPALINIKCADLTIPSPVLTLVNTYLYLELEWFTHFQVPGFWVLNRYTNHAMGFE
jgi:hypothetical protein